MVFITEGFFDVAIESWPEWDICILTCKVVILKKAIDETSILIWWLKVL